MIIVPKIMEEEGIKRFHNDVREGHPGEARTTEKIQRQIYFPGMMKKIRRWIKGCDDCGT
jgi:integrase-like protein